MPKFKKGNTVGFKKGCIPHLRSKESEKNLQSTTKESLYIRPEAESLRLARDKPSYGLRPQKSSGGGKVKILRPKTRSTHDAGNSMSEDDYER